MKKRVFLIVLDSLGIGASPDAAEFGDAGANTLYSLYKSDRLYIPTLTRLGLTAIDGVNVDGGGTPEATVCRLCELSAGKDTVTGHFEMMGIVSESAMPTYPEGFPEDILDEFERITGFRPLCNLPYSGTDVIRDFGDEHVASKRPIVYTSADSVFQIACHEDLYPTDRLYDICRKMREVLVGEHGVGRVIARPFGGDSGNYYRTANRRDFALPPPKKTTLDYLNSLGFDVIGVGKIGDIFAMQGLTESHPTHSNEEGMELTSRLAQRDLHGLCFVNLVDFDMLYGHRQDAQGYAEALNKFDLWLGGFIDTLTEEDALIITADHGCDPSDSHTDHTREYVPFILYEKGRGGGNLGTKSGFGTVGATVKELLTK